MNEPTNNSQLGRQDSNRGCSTTWVEVVERLGLRVFSISVAIAGLKARARVCDTRGLIFCACGNTRQPAEGLFSFDLPLKHTEKKREKEKNAKSTEVEAMQRRGHHLFRGSRGTTQLFAGYGRGGHDF